MIIQKLTLLSCLLALSMCLSCRMMDTLRGNHGAGTVERLWADVPALEDAAKADLEIPLGARLIIRTAMRGKINFIAFTTNRSAREVQDFYTIGRMQAAGWTAVEAGCVSDTEEKDIQGAICLFLRQTKGKEEGLAIILAQDEKSKQTDIFYARIDLTENSPESMPAAILSE